MLIMLTAMWFGWAFVCAWLVRAAAFALLPRSFGKWSYLVAYAWWPGVFIFGAIIAEGTGFQMYGYDPNSWMQQIGRVIFLYSPLGLPVVFGGLLVIAFDVATLVWRKWARSTLESAE